MSLVLGKNPPIERERSASLGRVLTGARADAAWMSAIALLAALLYLPTLGFDFVNWDDPWYVVENPLIRSWSPSNLYAVGTEIVIRNYAPVTIFSYLVDHTFWGLNPAGYHLTNLILHAINAVLVYALILQLTGSRFTAVATAALFAVHPVQVESVAWVASRKGLISATFILSALVCWLRPNRTPRQQLWGIAFLAIALFAKVIAMVVPAIVLLYDVLVLRKRLAEAVVRQFVSGLLSLWMLLVNMSAQTTELGGIRAHLGLSKLHMLGIDATILWRYVGLLCWPADLCVLYNPPTSGIGWQIALAIAAWGVVGIALWRIGRTQPIVWVAASAAILFLLPVLNLFPLTTLMNDRYLYLPSIPLFALFGAELAKAGGWLQTRELRMSRILAGATLGVLTSAAALRTADYLPVWRNGEALWTHALAHVPELPVVQIQWANTLHDAGRNVEAVAVLERTLATLNPDELDRERIGRKLAEWSTL